MRKLMFILAFFLCLGGMLKAQENREIVVKGTVMVLGQTSVAGYMYVHFPRKNFIIKRGAMPNFNALIGKELVVENVETNSSGVQVAILRRKDGLNFFRFYPTVRAELKKALGKGELIVYRRS